MEQRIFFITFNEDQIVLKDWKIWIIEVFFYENISQLCRMCLEKVWVIPISGKCCRKILSEKWKINPFFQFCSWHFQPSNRTKRLVSWPSSPLLTSNWTWPKVGNIWWASAGYDDTWRWRGWARHVDYFSCSRYCVSQSRLSPEAARTIFSDVAWWSNILAVNTGGQFAVFISMISNYSDRITRTPRP